MSNALPQCRITVLKRSLRQDLVDEYLKVEGEVVLCERCVEGQEFVVEPSFEMPEGFCPWAWADIRSDVMVVFAGGNPPWIKQPGTVITGCTDWFRPVIFKVERVQ